MKYSKDMYLNLFKNYYKSTAIEACFINDKDCSEKVINSHSIQNSFVIDQLERENHVCVIDYGAGGISFKTIGRNRASTFTGFCSHHDTDLFKRIDFKKGDNAADLDDEQRVLFHFRALAREYWSKLNAVKCFTFVKTAIEEKNKDNILKIYPFLKTENEIDWTFLDPKLLESSIHGHTMGINDAKPIYGSVLTQIKRKKFHLTKSLHLIINSQAPFAVSSFLSPISDFEGNLMNDFLGKTIHFLGLNVFPHEGKTHVILTWHKNSPIEQIGSQLEKMAEEDRKVNLSKFILAHSENVVFDKKWVDELPAEKLETIKKVFISTTAANPVTLNFLLDVNLFE